MPPPPAGYAADSDADDEYERSLMTSPTVATDDDTSPTESDPPSTENTPTTFGYGDGDGTSPRTIITEWTADECAGFIKSLGLAQYCGTFLENEIVGEALVALRHDELKEMGVSSVGHRLTILKGVYETKVKQDIPFEADHYVPLSAEASNNNKKATQEDISRIIRSLKLRDERIYELDAELKKMTEEYRKLRDELTPVFQLAKERENGLSSPIQASTNLTSRHNKRGAWPNSTPKMSPTYASHVHDGKPHTAADATALDPSAAALAASSHLTASLAADGRGPTASPNPALPSPTSPGYGTHTLVSATQPRHQREPQTVTSARGGHFPYEDLPQFYGSNTPSTANSLGPESAGGHRGGAPTPTPGRGQGQRRDDDPPPSAGPGSAGGGGSSSTPSVEIFKSFRVSMEDPCHKVLPAALKKYNINADWRQYALYIVYGDQERCLGLEEKPLILFKQLDKEGRKPMFMLRRHAAPLEGHSGPSGGGGMPPQVSGFEQRGGQIQLPQLPGGVL